MRITLLKKTDPAVMRKSHKRELILTLQKLGAQKKPVKLESFAKAARIKSSMVLVFKKKVREMRREGLIRTVAA